MMMLWRKAKHKIGDLLKCVISVGLGMKYTDSKGRRQPQSPIISDNGGVWEYLQIIGGMRGRFGHRVLMCLRQRGKVGSGRKQVRPIALKPVRLCPPL